MANTRDYLKELLDKHEGNKEGVYLDTKDNPTIGRGLNLNSPVVKTYFQGRGMDPAGIAEGQLQPQPADLEDAYNYVTGIKSKEFDNIKNKNFSGIPLNAPKEAALKSLYFNSPELIGNNIRKHLEQGNDSDVTKEILLNSNKDKSPGVLKRRLDEAKYYAQDKFPEVVNSLQPHELSEMQSIIGQLPDTAEKRQILAENEFLRPGYTNTPPLFDSQRLFTAATKIPNY